MRSVGENHRERGGWNTRREHDLAPEEVPLTIGGCAGQVPGLLTCLEWPKKLKFSKRSPGIWMLAPYFTKARSTPTAQPRHSRRAYSFRRLPPLHWLCTACPLPGVCPQMLIFCLKVLPPGLKLSAKRRELTLLKNGDGIGNPPASLSPAVYSAQCGLHLWAFPHPLCRDQCPLGQSSPEALHRTWLHPFSLLPGPFLLSPNYTVSLLGQVQSLSNYLTLPIFPQAWSQCFIGLPLKSLLS